MSSRACLRTNVQELQASTDTLRGKLEGTLGHFDDVLISTETLQSEVSDEVSGECRQVRVNAYPLLVTDCLWPTPIREGPSSTMLPAMVCRVQADFMSMPVQASAKSSRPIVSQSECTVQFGLSMQNLVRKCACVCLSVWSGHT